MIFMGRQSHIHVRQLQGSLAWEIIRARHRLGATLYLLSRDHFVGAWVLPVYEIYKVGEDVHTKEGLNFLPGLDWIYPLSRTGTMPRAAWISIPAGVLLEWNVSTVARAAALGSIIVGLDEHSGIIMDFEKGRCDVHGVSSVTLRKRMEWRSSAGRSSHERSGQAPGA